jgi:hypothetical protein
MTRTISDLNEQPDGRFEAEELNGLVELSNSDYHNGPGVSKSQLDQVAISPLAYWGAYLDPEREPRDYKHAFAVGDGTHKLVLEPGTFESTYAVGFDKKAFPDALDTMDDMKQELSRQNMITSGSKPELARRLFEEAEYPADKIMHMLQIKHEETMKGRVLIPAADYRNMRGMLRRVQHEAGGLLHNASIEQSYFWRDGAGVLRKCRTDAISANGQFVVDLKTTEDVSERGFGYTIGQRRYHVQAAWYLDILKALYGNDAPQEWAIIAAQKTRPNDVVVYYLTPDQIEAGRILYKQDLAKLVYHLSLGDAEENWPGMANGEFLEARIPSYFMDVLYKDSL